MNISIVTITQQTIKELRNLVCIRHITIHNRILSSVPLHVTIMLWTSLHSKLRDNGLIQPVYRSKITSPCCTRYKYSLNNKHHNKLKKIKDIPISKVHLTPEQTKTTRVSFFSLLPLANHIINLHLPASFLTFKRNKPKSEEKFILQSPTLPPQQPNVKRGRFDNENSAANVNKDRMDPNLVQNCPS